MKSSVGVPVHATSAERALSTLNPEITGVECKVSFSGCFTPGKEHRCPLKRRLGVSLRRYGHQGTEKSFVYVDNRTFPCSLFTVPTELSLWFFKRHLQTLPCTQLTVSLPIHYSALTSRLWTTEEVLRTGKSFDIIMGAEVRQYMLTRNVYSYFAELEEAAERRNKCLN